MKLKLKSKIIPVGIIVSIAAFMIIFAKDGHNTINISAIKGSLKDMNGIYAELDKADGKYSKVKYSIGKEGVVSKVKLLKQSSDTQDALITKVGKDPHDMIAYVGLYQDFPEVSSTPDNSTNKIVILKAKNEKYIPEKDMDVAESENQTSVADIDSTKYEKVMIKLNRSTKSGKVKDSVEVGEGFNPSLNYACRKDGNILLFISYTMDDSSTQLEVLKLNPETLDITTESKFNYKGLGASGISIYDTFMDNGKVVYLAEDYNLKNVNQEKVVFFKYDLAKKSYSSIKRTDFKLGDSFGYSVNDGVLSLRNVLSSKDGKRLDQYMINSFDIDVESMTVKSYSEYKTNSKITDYDYPVKDIYVDGDNLVYVISEIYTTNPNEMTVSGVSSPSLFRILDRNSGKIKFEGRITNTGSSYTDNIEIQLKGDGYNE